MARARRRLPGYRLSLGRLVSFDVTSLGKGGRVTRKRRHTRTAAGSGYRTRAARARKRYL